MKTEIIDGKRLSQEILEEVRHTLEVAEIVPELLIFQVGENPASQQFVSLKQRKGKEVGIEVEIEKVPEDKMSDSFTYISNEITLRKNSFDGIMIQLPLPVGIDTTQVLALIPSEFDVDGLRLSDSPVNTAVADAVLFAMAQISDFPKDGFILILGDSPYVGGSIATALKKNRFSNITCVNEFTTNKEDLLATADFVISCIGKPHLYHAEQLKEGAILIDVGTSRNTEGFIVGDFNTTEAEGHLRAYTPVPGGIGPLTVAMLLKHTAENAILKRQAK